MAQIGNWISKQVSKQVNIGNIFFLIFLQFSCLEICPSTRPSKVLSVSSGVDNQRLHKGEVSCFGYNPGA